MLLDSGCVFWAIVGSFADFPEWQPTITRICTGVWMPYHAHELSGRWLALCTTPSVEQYCKIHPILEFPSIH